jgi:hypothetical protein
MCDVSILDFKEFLKALNPEINARSSENEDGSSESGMWGYGLDRAGSG